MKSSTRVKLSAIAAAGGLAVTLLVGGSPASALGTKSPACGAAQYTASSTVSKATSAKKSTNDCESYSVRGRYYYNGAAYWTGWATNSTSASVTGMYDGFDRGEHYTRFSGTITT